MNFKKFLGAVCSFLLAASSFVTKSEVSATRRGGYPACLDNRQHVAIISSSRFSRVRNFAYTLRQYLESSNRFDTWAGNEGGGTMQFQYSGLERHRIAYCDKNGNSAFQFVIHAISDLCESDFQRVAEYVASDADADADVLVKPDVVILHLDYDLDYFSDDNDAFLKLGEQYRKCMNFLDVAGWNKDNIYIVCSSGFMFEDGFSVCNATEERKKRVYQARLDKFKNSYEGWLSSLGYPFLLFANEDCNAYDEENLCYEPYKSLHTLDGNPVGFDPIMDFIGEKLTACATPTMRESNKKFLQFFLNDDESESEEEESKEEEPKEEEPKEEEPKEEEPKEEEPKEEEPKSEKEESGKNSGWSTGKKAAVGVGVGAIGTLATIFGRNHHKNKNKTKVQKAQKAHSQKTKVATVE